MSAIIALIAFSLLYFLGYKTWAPYIATKVFKIEKTEITPAHKENLRDNIDYLPVSKNILWGHHYTSVAGAAPIIGPAVAIIWGWLPALLWVVFGTIFIGAVHDFSALVVSVRHDGKTIGNLSGVIIHKRVRILFQLIIYFLIWIVLAVFAVAVGVLFTKYPATVIPINFEIIVSLIIGYLVFKKRVPVFWPSLFALILLYLMIYIGLQNPIYLHETTFFNVFISKNNQIISWAILLLIYSGIASILPVWLLLQPRDYINSHQLIVGLALLVLGLFILHPPMTAPIINSQTISKPSLFPFLFVTIACGAISGFHGLVSSGTTSKQLNKMNDAVPIGYGGMLGEGTLAIIATLAVGAGLQDWASHYHSWNASGINAVANFVKGAGNFMHALHIPIDACYAVVGVLVISFAATSMDTAARIQRLIVSEFGEAIGFVVLKNRYIATAIAILPVIPLVLAGKEAWGPLWALFGTTNQLIGAMTLLTIYVYLKKTQRPTLPIIIPMGFLILITTGAMLINIWNWSHNLISESPQGALITLVLGVIILILETWMIIEAWLILRQYQHLKLEE